MTASWTMDCRDPAAFGACMRTPRSYAYDRVVDKGLQRSCSL